jgi:hypothetical protein
MSEKSKRWNSAIFIWTILGLLQQPRAPKFLEAPKYIKLKKSAEKPFFGKEKFLWREKFQGFCPIVFFQNHPRSREISKRPILRSIDICFAKKLKMANI